MNDLAKKFKARLEKNTTPELDPNYNFFVYGQTGTGKTTLIKTLKQDCIEHDGRCLLLNNDDGDASILSALYDKDPYRWLYNEQVQTWADIQSAYLYLKDGDHPFRWVVLDDTTVMAGILLAQLNDEMGDDVWGAYGRLDKQFRKMLRNFRRLDINTLFIAREDTEKEQATAAFPGKALGSGNDGSSVLHEFDNAFRTIRVAEDDDSYRYELQTIGDDHVEAKKRDEFDAVDKFEPADIGAIRKKIVDSLEENLSS